jgi:predicted transcriptional regulator
MEAPKVFESEYRFCLILWEHEPISSTELVSLCAKQLEWKKSTTFTVIRRLIDRGVLKSENSIVTSLVSKEEVQRSESREFIEKTFSGSLPAFIAAFTKGKTLTPEEIVEIRRMIDTYQED